MNEVLIKALRACYIEAVSTVSGGGFPCSVSKIYISVRIIRGGAWF